MSASPVKELYNSSNGDRWVLSKNPSGMLVVSHHPNSASGGRVSEIGVDVFLAQGGRGPERQALVEALANLDVPDSSPKSCGATGSGAWASCCSMLEQSASGDSAQSI